MTFQKKKGIADKDCFMFHNGEKVTLDRGELWNTVEQTEKRKDARTAREFIVNLPHELDPKQRQELTAKFTEHLAKSLGWLSTMPYMTQTPKAMTGTFTLTSW